MKTICYVLALVAMVSLAVTNAYAGAEGRCKACHDFGATHKVGPGLAGIVGRKAGSTDFGKYSPALKKGGWVWNEENLRKWLTNSKEAIKELSGDPNAKTLMPSQRLKGAKLDKVIEFLKGI